jgi:SAM-dependent methyltransferase
VDVAAVRPAGINLVKGDLSSAEGTFDLIMFHHSLEHIADHRGTLQLVARRLAPGGFCVIRMPVASSYAWEHYRENWVQIDAPRHFFIHTVNSIRLLGSVCGLELAAVIYDSTEFQFVGSEMYREGRPLANSPRGLFSRSELRHFRKRADRLNLEERGDSAAFLFRLKTPQA